MAKRRRVTAGTILVALLAAWLLSACGGGGAATTGNDGPIEGLARNRDGYADIDTDRLAALLEEKDVTLVNVHIPYEGELPETDLFIPYNEMRDHLDELPAKDAPIVLYCRSGNMSTTAARVLAQEGYTNVMELDGGFNAWKAEGREFMETR